MLRYMCLDHPSNIFFQGQTLCDLASCQCLIKVTFFVVLIWKLKKKMAINFSLPHLRHIKTLDFTSGGIQYHARWEIGDSIAVMSIKDHYFCGFSIPELFFCELSTLPVIISCSVVSL